MEITRNLLRKYAEGKCSREEIRAIEEFLEDGNRAEPATDLPLPSDVRPSIWDKVQQSRLPVIRQPMQWRSFIRVAAIFLLITLGAASTVYFLRFRSRKDEWVYTTTKDNRRTILLSDSSIVFLGPSSSIRLLQPFTGDRREIFLSGEASFEVAKDPLHPFTVVSGTIHTTALGTSFKVSAPAGSDSIHVALSSGKVVVRNQSDKEKEAVDQFFLEPGEGVTYVGSGHLKKSGTHHYNYKEDILYFRSAGIKEVMDKLTAFYHIQIQYETVKDVHWQVSGEFDYQPLDIVLQNIAYTCNIQYSLENENLTISPIRK